MTEASRCDQVPYTQDRVIEHRELTAGVGVTILCSRYFYMHMSSIFQVPHDG